MLNPLFEQHLYGAVQSEANCHSEQQFIKVGEVATITMYGQFHRF
jgi:hypothetical protein